MWVFLLQTEFSGHIEDKWENYQNEILSILFNPLTAYPVISTGNSNVAKSAYLAISSGMCFSSFIDELIPFTLSLST